jgi:bifunctional NMN adenylyltransferase/nudix hydrolase
MGEINIKDYPIGVFIGRLQVHKLHEGHLYAINQVVENHKKTIIFLGVPKFIGTKNNPLDFDTRKKMVQTLYPECVIVALPDQRDNEKWAKELEKRIREVYPHGEVLLYGGRDSFIPFYINNGGIYKTTEIKSLDTFAGTDVRKLISEEVKNSEDFRSGVIYHSYNLYPRVIPTIDIAPINNEQTKVLLGKKFGESKFRFIGGFVLPSDNNLEHSVKRIYKKEAGDSEIINIKYITSLQINDWRYKGEEDKIMSCLYTCEISWGRIVPSDDIIELRYFNLSDLTNDNYISTNIIEEHIDLMKILIQTIKK